MVKVKEELKGLIEPFIYDNLDRDQYRVERVEAEELLSTERLDLGAKIFYLKHKKSNPNLALEVYQQHLEIITTGSFREYGNSSKNGIASFVKSFEELSKSYNELGFLDKKSVIPISEEGVLMNGAHRTALAVVENVRVSCVRLVGHVGQSLNYNWFLKRGLSKIVLEKMVDTIVEHKSNLRCAVLWPKFFKEEDIKEFSNQYSILYHKASYLNEVGLAKLMPVLYPDEPWVGNFENSFIGAYGKVGPCFLKNQPCVFIIFEADNSSAIECFKDNWRKHKESGKHSIHISNNIQETRMISKHILNPQFEEYYNVDISRKSLLKISEIINLYGDKNIVDNFNLSDSFIIDGTIIMEILGIRTANDVDICHFIDLGEKDNHIREWNKLNINANAFFVDNINYVYLFGLRVISLKGLRFFKEQRAEKKDVLDIRLMDNYGKYNKYKEFYHKFGLSWIKLKYKIFVFTLKLLDKLGLYKVIKSVYRKWKNYH